MTKTEHENESDNGTPFHWDWRQALRERPHLWLFGLIAFLLPLLYALYTGNVWEDYLITFRHSKNLVDGHGPVFVPGERVHGFTSPINTMLPAFFYWITGGADHVTALWLYRLVSALFFAAGGILILYQMRNRRTVSIWFALYYLLAAKPTMYAGNGQESGFMLCFLALSIVGHYWEHRLNWLVVGLGWTGLMYTRPDSCVFIAALGLAALAVGCKNRKTTFIRMLKAGAVCTVLYLPWFVWAWSYFGSPIPHSAIAKSATAEFSADLSFMALCRQFTSCAGGVFMPVYAFFGGWPAWLGKVGLAMGIIPCFYWLIPSKDHMGRTASLAYVGVCAYLAFFVGRNFIFPWYFPPAEFLGGLTLASCFVTVAQKIGKPEKLRHLTAALNGGLAAVLLFIYGGTWVQMKHQQAIIEDGHRKQIGLWLNKHAAENETIYLEPLGYIGFYSQRHVLDYPGLVSPSVVELRRKTQLNFYTAIPYLAPNWLVLRPYGAKKALAIPEVKRDYYLKKAFDVRPQVLALPFVPGIGYLAYDCRFLVFQRKSDAPPAKPIQLESHNSH